MKENKNEYLQVLRKIENNPNTTQRQQAKNLGYSLGKLNYVLQSLKKKGLIKIQNFTKSKNKVNYLYLLTPQGISSKTKLTINFMKKKLNEYDTLKTEIDDVDTTKFKNQPIKKIDHNLL